ncbi:MAG: radical SAM protein [Candidatus Omnitrophica bacterium]|nr:radical SAM protein [Candidatus Omnitrophota bacterium]
MKDKIEKILPYVKVPARYLGKEINVYIKKEKKVNFALGYPDLYEVGMSSLGVRILYGVLNERSDCKCERFFLPWIDFEEFMKKENIPLFTLETKTPLSQFDIIGISLSSELNYTNFLNMLYLSNIPIFSSDRKNEHPIVIVGGNCSFNPLPLIPFTDAFVIGEGEEVINQIVDVVKENKGNRNKILENLNKIDSVYIPSLPKKQVKKAIVKDLNNTYFPTRYLIPLTNIVHDRIAIEIMRGCIQGCKFCQAGVCWKPVRIRSFDKIFEIAKEAFNNTGYEEISLLSFSTGDHPQIEKIITKLVDEFKNKKVSISFPSLRIDTFSFQLALKIKEIKKTNLTFAPETSERLRKEIGKDIKDQELINLVKQAKQNNYRHIKLYFMIGLPEETESDIVDIVKLINEISKIIFVNVSFNTFIPKPHTFFQGERFISETEYEEKRSMIVKGLMKNKYVKLKFHPYKASCVECFLGRGDEGLAKVIYKTWEKGARFENWKEFFDFDKWEESFKEEGIEMNKYLKKINPPYSWSFINL